MKVLVVDDSPAIRQRLSSRLKEIHGIDLVASVADGYGALRSAESLDPDVVLLDLSIPGLSGIEVLASLKSTADPPVVIVLTNHADATYRTACFRRGADFFFDKSEELEAMVNVLRNLHQSQKGPA